MHVSNLEANNYNNTPPSLPDAVHRPSTHPAAKKTYFHSIKVMSFLIAGNLIRCTLYHRPWLHLEMRCGCSAVVMDTVQTHQPRQCRSLQEVREIQLHILLQSITFSSLVLSLYQFIELFLHFRKTTICNQSLRTSKKQVHHSFVSEGTSRNAIKSYII